MSSALFCIIIALAVSAACVIPGVFLVIRGMALLSDALSHALVFSIAVLFLMTGEIHSWHMLVGACITGLCIAWSIEALIATKRIHKDAAIAIIFPLFFSVGVILISKYARNVHLDLDMIILGELIFAPFQRIVLNAVDLGPVALWNAIFVLALVTCLGALLYHRIKLVMFDPLYAQSLGIVPHTLFFIVVALASISAVTAFDSVGAVVVVALMIVPVAAALLITYQLSYVILYALMLACASAVGGYAGAWYYNVSVAGAIGTVSGLFFILCYIAAPYKGLLARTLYYRQKRAALYARLADIQKKSLP